MLELPLDDVDDALVEEEALVDEELADDVVLEELPVLVLGEPPSPELDELEVVLEDPVLLDVLEADHPDVAGAKPPPPPPGSPVRSAPPSLPPIAPLEEPGPRLSPAAHALSIAAKAPS